MRVLLVEDDSAIAPSMIDGLADFGIDAVHCSTGATAIALASADEFDCVLLDLGLPDMDGIEVCKRLQHERDTPIIIVSARSAEIDRVVALETGADDYLVKPFGMRELVARIRAVHRRHDQRVPSDPTDLTVGTLVLDLRALSATIAGAEVHFTPKEFAIVHFLASDPGATFRRSDIIRGVWETDWVGGSKSLDAHIASIRKKLSGAATIVSVHGVGFRIEESS